MIRGFGMKKQISFKTGITKIAQLLDGIGQMVLMAVMLLVVLNIVMRTLFDKPITGVYDLVSLFMVIVIALALANCAAEKGHIAVEFLVERFPAGIQRIIDIIMNIASFIFIGLFTYNVGVYAYAAAVAGDESFTLKIPHYPFIYLVCIGYLLLCMVIIINLFDHVKEVSKQ
jgi:TRAP-type C4-dicarboxylate transport system permease small subunit